MASKREIFAKNFRREFEKSPFNQVQFADRCSVSKATVGDWLYGRTMPRLEKIGMIAGLLGVTTQDLLTDFESQEKAPREIMDIARELYEDPASRKLYELCCSLSPENKQALIQIAQTMSLSQKN